MTEAEVAAVIRGIAPIVREQIATAVNDLTPRLAAVEATLARLPAHEQTLGDLRDRVVRAETKADQQQPPTPVAIDLTPVLERVAAAEARLQTLGDLRDRVVTIETKAADSPVLGDLPTRVAVLETQMSALSDRVTAIEQDQADLADTTASTGDAFTKDLGALRERVAVVEVRAPVPGPPGQDGRHGKDGADGLGFDDLTVEHDGERGFTFRYTRGERTKDAGTFTVPVQMYRGVYAEGRTYEPGDTVTWAGSMWHCQKATVLRPDTVAVDGKGGNGKDFWTMVVKRGQEGKAGRDGRDLLPLPVVSSGGPR